MTITIRLRGLKSPMWRAAGGIGGNADAIARGRRWLDELIADPTASADSIARREQMRGFGGVSRMEDLNVKIGVFVSACPPLVASRAPTMITMHPNKSVVAVGGFPTLPHTYCFACPSIHAGLIKKY
jgi:hypothetical protein